MTTLAVEAPQALFSIQQAKEWYPSVEIWEDDKTEGYCVGGAVVNTLLRMGYALPELRELLEDPSGSEEWNFPDTDALGCALKVLNSHFTDENLACCVAEVVIIYNDDAECSKAWELMSLVATWDGEDKTVFDPNMEYVNARTEA